MLCYDHLDLPSFFLYHGLHSSKNWISGSLMKCLSKEGSSLLRSRVVMRDLKEKYFSVILPHLPNCFSFTSYFLIFLLVFRFCQVNFFSHSSQKNELSCSGVVYVRLNVSIPMFLNQVLKQFILCFLYVISQVSQSSQQCA